jgi:hypothetical protein
MFCSSTMRASCTMACQASALADCGSPCGARATGRDRAARAEQRLFWWGILAPELQFNHGSSLSSSFACRDAEESVNESPFHSSSPEEAPQSNRLHGLLIKASAARETLRPHLLLSLRTHWHGHSLRHAVFDCRASSPCSRLASAAHVLSSEYSSSPSDPCAVSYECAEPSSPCLPLFRS